MTPDSELLRRYAGTKSEEAFAELVRRHVNLVYSAALRQVNGDTHLAQDVAQTVFTDLARKAAPLSRREVFTIWLYTSAHYGHECRMTSFNERQKFTSSVGTAYSRMMSKFGASYSAKGTSFGKLCVRNKRDKWASKGKA
jgi:hypothetical protein